MAEYKGRQGVWMIYGYDVGPYVDAIYPDERTALEANAFKYNQIGFLPFGMSLTVAIKLWNKGEDGL